MTKKKINKKKLSAKKNNSRKKRRVWHIFHFAERYELPDDVRYERKRPLKYTKSFVGSGSDNESISFAHQLNLLRASKDRANLRNAFEELKEVAANRSRAYRGYLLDEKLRPADVKRVSQWIGEDIVTTKKLLQELECIGLIERVDVPQFNPSDDDFPQNSRKHRKPPETTGNPLKKRRSGSKTANSNKKKKKKKKVSADRKAEITTSPTAAPVLIKPKEADAGMGRARIECPSLSVYGCENIGNIVRKLPYIKSKQTSLLSQRAKQFGFEIYQALRILCTPTSLEGRRELAAFANAWARAETSGLSSTEEDNLWQKSMKDATNIGKTRHRKVYKKSPEAVWMFQFNARLRSMIRKAEAG